MEYFRKILEPVEVHLKEADAFLVKLPHLRETSDRVGIRPCFMPVCLLALLLIFMGYMEEFLATAFSVTYPAYASFKALRSAKTTDDRQWLTYWVIYGGFALFEATFRPLIPLVPFYYFQKIALCLYLSYYNGSSVIYALVEPYLVRVEVVLDEMVDRVIKAGKELTAEKEK